MICPSILGMGAFWGLSRGFRKSWGGTQKFVVKATVCFRELQHGVELEVFQLFHGGQLESFGKR